MHYRNTGKIWNLLTSWRSTRRPEAGIRCPIIRTNASRPSPLNEQTTEPLEIISPESICLTLLSNQLWHLKELHKMLLCKGPGEK